VPEVPSDSGEGAGGLAGGKPVVPTPIEAVAALRTYAINPATPQNVTASIAVALDHIANLEMTLTLLRNGFESAFRHAPENAIIEAGKKRI
jgi:hypothetical protein